MIELLVIFAIIAMLAAMLFPSLSKARDQANTLACINNIRQWGTAISLFSTDNNGLFPELVVGETYGWYDEVYPYLISGTSSDPSSYPFNRSEFLLRRFIGVYCPTAQSIVGLPQTPVTAYHSYINYYGQTHMHVMNDPYINGGIVPGELAHFNGTYLINLAAVAKTWCTSNCYNDAVPSKPLTIEGARTARSGTDNWSQRVARHRYPGATSLLMEGVYWGESGCEYYWGNNPQFDSYNPNPTSGHLEFRHRRGTAMNVLFVDGHVATYTRKTIPEYLNYNSYVAAMNFYLGGKPEASKFWYGTSTGVGLYNTSGWPASPD